MKHPESLVKNAYNILGLKCLSPISEVHKRGQYLVQLAKIDETEQFKTDIGNSSQYRVETEIRKAVEKLNNIKERLSEAFFWFEFQGVEVEKLAVLMSKGDYGQAIDIYEKRHQLKHDWLAKKDLALCSLFQAFFELDITLFDKALKRWKELIESEQFWGFYERYYRLHDEIGADASLFEEFKERSIQFLAKITCEFYHCTEAQSSVGIFYNYFGCIEESLDSKILQPIISGMKDTINKIENICNSDSSQKRIDVEPLLGRILVEHNKLSEFNLLGYSPIDVLKNDIAESLRSASISVNNDHDDYDLAVFLLSEAEKFASSEDVTNKIREDKKLITANQNRERLFLKLFSKSNLIEELFDVDQFTEAYQQYLIFDQELSNPGMYESSEERIQFLLICIRKFQKKADQLMDNKKYSEAERVYYFPFEMLLNRIDLFFYNQPVEREEFKKVLQYVIKVVEFSDDWDLDALIDRVNQVAEKFEDDRQKEAIHAMGALGIGRALCRRLSTQQRNKIFKWMGWAALALVFWCLNS